MLSLVSTILGILASALELGRWLTPLAPVPTPNLAALIDERPAATEITFAFQNLHAEETFALREDDGSVRNDALKALSKLLRCWRTGRTKMLHPRTVEIVSEAARHFGKTRVEVISGFRAPPFGAPHSKHFLGRAIDFRLEGVSAKKLADWLWANFRGVGVGYYPRQGFVHVDSRDVDVRWIDPALHGESNRARYIARRPDEPLPAGAPRLAYDERRAAATSVAVAVKSGALKSDAAPVALLTLVQ
jgi:uncharacterized protein YcbK (DUF882 family)